MSNMNTRIWVAIVIGLAIVAAIWFLIPGSENGKQDHEALQKWTQTADPVAEATNAFADGKRHFLEVFDDINQKWVCPGVEKLVEKNRGRAEIQQLEFTNRLAFVAEDNKVIRKTWIFAKQYNETTRDLVDGDRKK